MVPGSQKNKCPAVKNSRTISMERQFTPSRSILYLFARRFKSAFWFNLQFTKFPSLSKPLTRLCGVSYLGQSLPIRECKICVTHTQGFLVTQTLQFHLHTLVELKFSSFSPTNLTDYHLLFGYYLALEKNKGALERKMNHSLSF